MKWLVLLVWGCVLIECSVGVPAGAGGTGAGVASQGQGKEYVLEDYVEEGDSLDSVDEDLEEKEEEGLDASKAVLTSKGETLEPDLGAEFELPCEGDAAGFVTLWEKDGAPLFVDRHAHTNDLRLSLNQGSHTLRIANASAKDSGKYECRYSTDHPVQVIHTVHVKHAPHVHVAPTVHVLNNGDRANLSCTVSGYPKPQVFWERKGKKMPGGEDKVQGSLVTFDSVTRHHAGIYECYAENAIGSARTALDLQVRYAPEVEVEKESVNTGKGLAADLVCLVWAEPKATVLWLKDGEELKAGDREEHVSHRYTLHLRHVHENDFGRYECLARNNLGEGKKSIAVSGAPSQPALSEEESGVGLEGKDGVSYRLVWTLESTVPVDNFTLRLRMPSGSWTEESVKGDLLRPQVFQVNHTVTNLVPDQDYQATLQAHNEFGWSNQSHAHTFHVTSKDFQSVQPEPEMRPGAKAVGSAGSGSSRVSLSAISTALVLIATSVRW